MTYRGVNIGKVTDISLTRLDQVDAGQADLDEVLLELLGGCGVDPGEVFLDSAVEASARGEVVDSGVEVEDATHVKVVLFVDQRITGEAEGTSEPDQSRVTMHMVEQGGVWLVDNVELKSYALNQSWREPVTAGGAAASGPSR